MKRSKMPTDPNRRAMATADVVDAILNAWPETVSTDSGDGRRHRGSHLDLRGDRGAPGLTSPQRSLDKRALARRIGISVIADLERQGSL